jgi:hypothetical protein
MTIIVFAIVVLLIVALLIWAVSMLTMIPNPINQIIMALIVLLGAVLIAQKAGVF